MVFPQLTFSPPQQINNIQVILRLLLFFQEQQGIQVHIIITQVSLPVVSSNKI